MYMLQCEGKWNEHPLNLCSFPVQGYPFVACHALHFKGFYSSSIDANSSRFISTNYHISPLILLSLSFYIHFQTTFSNSVKRQTYVMTNPHIQLNFCKTVSETFRQVSALHKNLPNVCGSFKRSWYCQWETLRCNVMMVQSNCKC